MATSTVWNTALAVLGSIGGGGAIVLALSGWLGKLWASRMMAGEVNRHNQEIEALKAKLTIETEDYKARFRKSEFVFQKEYEAASALARVVSDIQSSYRDAWMDDEESFLHHLEGWREDIAKTLEAFLSRHSAILTDDIRGLLTRARVSCVVATSEEMPAGRDGAEAARECWSSIVEAETLLIRQVREQTIPVKSDAL